VFTTKVMHRNDCNSPFWKEEFINGLPTLFGEKVKETLCSPLGFIDYDNLTSVDISSTITTTNPGLGGVFFSDVFKSAAISSILRRF